MNPILESQKFGELDLKDLQDFENANQFRLPEDYRDFLLRNNGGIPQKNRLGKPATVVHWLYGMHNGPDWANFFHALQLYSGRLPSWYIPIGCDDAGNLFLMSMYEENKGIVVFWDHEGEVENAHQHFDNLIFVADSFSNFLERLK